MASQFDELAKNLAGGMSRREALRRFGLGLLGALLAALGLGGLLPREALGQNSNCDFFCKGVYPNDPARQSSCAGAGGLCSQCGPAAPAPRRSLCNAPGNNAFCCPAGQNCCSNSTCFNLQTNLNNCGACGRACQSPNTACCSGVCKNTNVDALNCGTCGNICPTPAHAASVFCSGGICGFTCQTGYTPSGGQCVPTGVSACQTGNDPETGSSYVVCSASATEAWISANYSGTYHPLQICQLLGYSSLGGYGGTCGNVCGYCQRPTSCESPGNKIFDGANGCPGSDAHGMTLCFTVQWQCLA